MSIIKIHDITLYGGSGTNIVLRPLCDKHLPLLYKWNADPEVLYWTEGGADIPRSYDRETVHDIYGGVSQSALCFLIEADGVPIGECWLQKMNLPRVLAMYPGLNVRRIDMAIGEKEYWGRGIGRQFIGMLIDYAFCGAFVDVLHCLSEDYNIRSRKMWEKHGFALVRREALPPMQKGKEQLHFALTRGEFIARRRFLPPKEKAFALPLKSLQPSQLYISAGKLRLAQEWFHPKNPDCVDPIPVKSLDGKRVMTDGHTRAVLCYLAGWTHIPAYWEEDELNWQAYRTDVKWCAEEGIGSIADLTKRIVPHEEYEHLWRKRCMEM